MLLLFDKFLAFSSAFSLLVPNWVSFSCRGTGELNGKDEEQLKEVASEVTEDSESILLTVLTDADEDALEALKFELRPSRLS